MYSTNSLQKVFRPRGVYSRLFFYAEIGVNSRKRNNQGRCNLLKKLASENY